MVLTGRNRFYKKIFLYSESIPTSDTWKNLKILDSDGIDEISNKLEFPTNLTTVVISLDGGDKNLEYSFDGRELDGELLCDDGPFSQDGSSDGYLYLRLPEGTVLTPPSTKIQVRIWAWRGGAGR